MNDLQATDSKLEAIGVNIKPSPLLKASEEVKIRHILTSVQWAFKVVCEIWGTKVVQTKRSVRLWRTKTRLARTRDSGKSSIQHNEENTRPNMENEIPVGVQYPGTVAKNECSMVLEICPTSNLTLNLPDSVDKCKTDIKTYLLMQPCYLISYV